MDILTALEHHRAGRLAEAVEIYQQILQTNPDHADALHLMGNAVCQLGDLNFAITLISKACDQVPNNTSYLISLGMAYRMNGQFDLSNACYSKVLELVPDSASAYFGIGNTEQCQGKLDNAAQSFIKAIELNPEFIEARYNLANVQKSLGQYLESINNYRIVVTSKPDFSDAFHNMGSAFYSLGKLDEALSSYKQGLNSNLPETHNNIGIILFDRGEFDQALACYTKAILLKPNYAEAYNNLGIVLRKLGKFQDATEAFKGAIKINPDYAIAYLNLGDLLMETDRFNEAAVQYELAIAADPKMAEAYFNLGITRTKLNDFPAAHSCFEHALACRPDYLDALYNLGVVNGHLLKHAEAERCYRDVLKLDTYHVNSNINLAVILSEHGRTTEARQHIDIAYSQKNIFVTHSSSANKTVLILFDAGKGNLNLSHLFNQKTNTIIDWMIEYASDEQFYTLPNHDLVFNAMGDPDTTGNTLEPVSRFLQVCNKPLLNHPDKVARTARNKLPALLDGIDNLLIPPVWRFANPDEWVESIGDQLPLLIRPAHTQGGIGLVLAKTLPDLEQARKLQSGPVYVSRFVDFRSADSWFRKYRIIFIDRKPYPYHLAISQNWMVHYYTSEMESYPWKTEEEKVFLQDPESALGCKGLQAITAIGERMDLDYAGIDFSIMADGRILVFEANPTMLVHPEKSTGPLAHKNIYVNTILNAFEGLLMRSVKQAINQ